MLINSPWRNKLLLPSSTDGEGLHQDKQGIQVWSEVAEEEHMEVIPI